MENLLLDVGEDGIGVLTINRPDKLNALNLLTLDELENTVESIEKREDVKCVIIRGSGEKAFIAGADIAFMQELNSVEAYEFSRKGQKIIKAMGESNKVYIAAVNGYALGGGFEIALGCDFIYASKNAKLGFPEVTLGILPGFGGTQNLSRITGKNIARELIFTGKMVTAEYAKQIGVVNEVLGSVDDLMKYARETAKKIILNGPVGVSLAKKAINNGFNLPEDEAYKYESTLFGMVFATEDAKEGLRAFTEKRKPDFKNK